MHRGSSLSGSLFLFDYGVELELSRFVSASPDFGSRGSRCMREFQESRYSRRISHVEILNGKSFTEWKIDFRRKGCLTVVGKY